MRTIIENREQIHEIHKFVPPPDFWKYCYDPDECPPETIPVVLDLSSISSGFADSLTRDFYNRNCDNYDY